MLFGLIRDTSTPDEERDEMVSALYNRAGNLEKSLQSIARHHPLTLLTPEQIRTYNTVVSDAKQIAPGSVVLKEDAPLIEEGDLPYAETFFRILHTAVVPTIHNILIDKDSGAALPGV